MGYGYAEEAMRIEEAKREAQECWEEDDRPMYVQAVERIERLKRQLAECRHDLNETMKRLAECQALVDEGLAVIEERNDELAECREAVDALGPGGAGWKEYYERSVDAWRGEDEMHESGERCARCDRLATVRGYPYCTVCFLEYQVDSLQNEWRLALEHAAQVAEDWDWRSSGDNTNSDIAAAIRELEPSKEGSDDV